MRRNLVSIAALLLALFSSSLFAADTKPKLSIETQDPLHIVADSSFFDYKSGVNTYEGHVQVDQGTSHLLADRVITKNNAQHKIAEAVAYGLRGLAEYSTTPKAGDDIFHAKAKVITYYPPKASIMLEGDVTVTQGENSFQGPVIIYNIKDQTVTAPSSKIGRATIVIEPNQMKS